jgi:phage tail sheath gpL-like
VALTAITLSASNYLALGSGLVEPSGASIDAANGNTIAAPANGWDRVVLRIVNTFAGAKSVTLAGGLSSASINKADLTIAMAQNEIRYIPVSPSSRFVQADGSITLTYTASMTGTVQVLCLPVGM